MTTLYLDTFSGISGDMTLGLLVDLGIAPDSLQAELGKLPVNGYRLEQRQEKRHGIGGTRLEVVCDGGQPSRTWSEIDTMIEASALPLPVKDTARRIFRCLGEAEAHVHRVGLDEVHFHEVGAVDAIVDIVGSAIGLHLLEIQEVICAPLPLSSGMTQGIHGSIPLPAPATLQILSGQPVRNAGSDQELVTPTGAAIAASVARFGPMPEMAIARIGYGVGGWDLEERPNLLRGIVGRQPLATGFEHDLVTVIESHIDDSSPEWLGALVDRLMDEGALDAALAPLQMKKNRPGSRLTVVAKPHDAASLARTILLESSAIGIRMYETRRIKLRRQSATVRTRLGDAEVKLIYEAERLLRITPEHASCQQLAKASGRPLPDVFRIVTATANRQFGLEE